MNSQSLPSADFSLTDQLLTRARERVRGLWLIDLGQGKPLVQGIIGLLCWWYCAVQCFNLESTMILRSNSFALRALLWVCWPCQYIPHRLVPLRVEACRVGQDYTSFVRVSWGA